ncbi:hypothetical protein HJG60_009416 [Phyllostomus discolor]|uniref:Uncharacterized protein n=1 Tax=Phyllostomus discolor TaxID=89673 RepID=A0A833YFW2_9CHIR|nr:hypothetical protein HJG60_009416 [Phyllostomus discolor]
MRASDPCAEAAGTAARRVGSGSGPRGGGLLWPRLGRVFLPQVRCHPDLLWVVHGSGTESAGSHRHARSRRGGPGSVLHTPPYAKWVLSSGRLGDEETEAGHPAGRGQLRWKRARAPAAHTSRDASETTEKTSAGNGIIRPRSTRPPPLNLKAFAVRGNRSLPASDARSWRCTNTHRCGCVGGLP